MRTSGKPKSVNTGPAWQTPHTGDIDPQRLEGLCRIFAGVILLALRAHVPKPTLRQIVMTTLAHAPDFRGRAVSAPRAINDDAAHMITVWRSKQLYLKDGRARPLAITGKPPSIESLKNEVNPALDLKAVMDYFHASNALEKVGRRHIPRSSIVRTRGTAYHADNQLRTIEAAIANFDHNAVASTSSWLPWHEFASECPQFPISKLHKLQEYIYEQGEAQLKDYDAFMRRYELARDPDEPTTRAGVEILHYERSQREQSPQFGQTLREVLAALGITQTPNIPRDTRVAGKRGSLMGRKRSRGLR
jgi:hypothetical protein